MKTEKKIQVVMLATNQYHSDIELDEKLSYNTNKGYANKNGQHLYFLSDDDIKKGELVLHKSSTIIECPEDIDRSHFDRSAYNKIISSTDKSLVINMYDINAVREIDFDIALPRPSNAFVQKYVEEYNKGNIITEVMVEYEIDYGIINNFIPYTCLKVKPDNTIIISAVEETWDDVFSNWIHYYNNGIGLKLKLMEYLKENYQVPKQIINH